MDALAAVDEVHGVPCDDGVGEPTPRSLRVAASACAQQHEAVVSIGCHGHGRLTVPGALVAMLSEHGDSHSRAVFEQGGST
jgi:hypothetical protein